MSLPMEKITLSAYAINASFGESESEKASKFVAIGFEILDEAHAGETITWLGYFTEKTTARTLESLSHMGFAGDDISELDDTDRETTMRLLPSAVDIVIEPEEYNGEWRMKVQWVNRSGGGRFAAKKPLKGAELKAFAAQMKGALKNARAGGPRPKSSGSGRTNEPHPNAPGNGDFGFGGSKEDDIPF